MKRDMKGIVVLLLLSLCMSTIAAESVDKTVTVDPQGVVEIFNGRGELQISGWDKSQVKVTGVLDELAREFVFSTQGAKTVISIKLPKNSDYQSRQGSKLDVKVPRGSKVKFVGVATRLNLSKIDGGADIRSVSGDISLRQVKGSVKLSSVNGALLLRDVVGKLAVSTVSGNLDAQVDSAEVRVTTVSSSLLIALRTIGSARFANVSGNTSVSGRLSPEGNIEMSSVSGNVNLVVDGEVNGLVMLETAPGGKIINDYSPNKPKSTFIHSHSLRFRTGKGHAGVKMSTANGSISLRKKRKS